MYFAKVLAILISAQVPGTSEDNDENPCSGRWHNMIHDMTSRMWGVFDETGIFVAICCHGFLLVVADMVQSGEL